MKESVYGGVLVREFGQEIKGEQIFASGTYSYSSRELSVGDEFTVSDMGAATIIVHQLAENSVLQI